MVSLGVASGITAVSQPRSRGCDLDMATKERVTLGVGVVGEGRDANLSAIVGEGKPSYVADVTMACESGSKDVEVDSGRVREVDLGMGRAVRLRC